MIINTETNGKTCLDRNDWPNHDQAGTRPPEVLVLAPEAGHPMFTADELRDMATMMRQRIADATAARIASAVGAS